VPEYLARLQHSFAVAESGQTHGGVCILRRVINRTDKTLKKQSTFEWMQAPKSAEEETELDVLFALQLECLTPGYGHVGGRHGAVVRCPRCQHSACSIGGHRYAHGVRLIRCWSSIRNANGEQVPVLDVRPEWQRICVGTPSPT
jgi:hypothetical protein